jgi:hypothetical protein
MASHTLIRGWIDCQFEDVEKIKKIILSHWQNSDEYCIETISAKLYLKGWHFPTAPINWISVISYGGHVKNIAVRFLYDSISTIAESKLNVRGLFHLEDEEVDDILQWSLSPQKLTQLHLPGHTI